VTAIFAVWNNYGFSLASDSNQTAKMNNQNFVDPVEKTLMLDNHQIAIAGAGATFHQGVEVNEIFRTWEASLPKKGFSRLEEYFVDFACWFSKQTFANDESSLSELRNKLQNWFTAIFQVIEDYETEIIPETLEILFFTKYSCSRDSLNIFGGEWDLIADSNEITEGALSVSFRKIEELRQLIVEREPTIVSNEEFVILAHQEFESEIASMIANEFEDIFKRKFDDENQIDMKILEMALCMIENWQMDYQPIEVLMIGYGANDWLPSAFQFSIQSKFFGLPRLYISDTSNPNENWYMKIAVESAVYQLTRGVSRETRDEIIEVVSKYISEEGLGEISSEINEKLSEKFHSTLSKIEYLTIDRLEFVSKLFVQIEALKSFLDQPIAGVGGDTKVISMTKTSRRERYFKEFQ